jgi:hypothetical protein
MKEYREVVLLGGGQADYSKPVVLTKSRNGTVLLEIFNSSGCIDFYVSNYSKKATKSDIQTLKDLKKIVNKAIKLSENLEPEDE